MDDGLDWLTIALELEEGYPDQLCFPETGGLYLMTGHNSRPHTGHMYFESPRASNPVFFIF